MYGDGVRYPVSHYLASASPSIWLRHAVKRGRYYRKVATLPCGRCKEIKKSLHTRDKLDCQQAEHDWIHLSSMS